MRRAALLSTLLLTGCPGPAGYESPDLALRTHVCTPEEMQRVEKETLFCQEKTSYLSTYCYSAAIQRVCTRRPTGAQNAQ